MFSELEVCRAAVRKGLVAIDDGDKRLPVFASLAKAKVAEVFHLVACEGVQMHGGIGMTDEHDIGLYLKRSRFIWQKWGTPAFHRDRYAMMKGY